MRGIVTSLCPGDRCARTIAAVITVILLSGSTQACITFTDLKHESIPLTGPRKVRSHVKAHLLDGSTVIYRDGVTISAGRVTGDGVRYDIRLDPAGSVGDIALDSVRAMESFRNRVDPVLTFLLPLLGTIGLLAVLGEQGSE